MKGLFRRGRTWWVRFTPAPGAAQQRFSLGTDDEVKAITAAQDLIRRMGTAAMAVAGSCEAEIEAYLVAKKRDGLAASTLQSRGYVLRQFAAHTAAVSPQLISRAAVEKWYNGQRAKSEHTAADYLATVKVWFKWLLDEGRLTQDQASLVKPPKKLPKKLPMRMRRTFLMPDQARQLLEACDDPGLKFAVYCGLHAGMRKGEIIEARPEWFDMTEGLIHVQATPTFEPKTRDCRTIPMTDEFKAWLLDEYKLHSPFMLLPHKKVKGRKINSTHRYRYDFRTAFENLTAACQFEVTFHDLRRTFASLLVSRGVSLYKVAKWLGDTTAVVENTYGHLIPKDDQINESWTVPAAKKAKKKAR